MVRLHMLIYVALAIAVTIVANWSLSQAEHRKTAELLELEATNARDLIAHDLHVRLDAATALLRDMPGFYAIAWIGTDNRVAMAEPQRSKPLIGRNLKGFGPLRVALAEKARASDQIHIGSKINLVNDAGTGFVMARAVRRNGQHIGTLWVVLQVSDWVQDLYAGANRATLEKLDLSIASCPTSFIQKPLKCLLRIGCSQSRSAPERLFSQAPGPQ